MCNIFILDTQVLYEIYPASFPFDLRCQSGIFPVVTQNQLVVLKVQVSAHTFTLIKPGHIWRSDLDYYPCQWVVQVGNADPVFNCGCGKHVFRHLKKSWLGPQINSLDFQCLVSGYQNILTCLFCSPISKLTHKFCANASNTMPGMSHDMSYYTLTMSFMLGMP